VNRWSLELFINPTKSLPLIVVACVVCLVLIGVVIIVLHWKEKKADQKNMENPFYYF